MIGVRATASMVAPISRKVAMSPVRKGLVITASRITSEPGTSKAATIGNAAEDGSAGTTTSVLSYVTYGATTRISELQRSFTNGGTTTLESLVYEYYASGESTACLQTVTFKRKVGTGSWTSKSGPSGALKLVVTQTASGYTGKLTATNTIIGTLNLPARPGSSAATTRWAGAYHVRVSRGTRAVVRLYPIPIGPSAH